MARVVFIDKLIRSGHGHNLEYCTRQVPFFKERGYSAVVLVNRRYAGPKPPEADLRPVIDFDFNRLVGGPGLLANLSARLKAQLGDIRVRVRARLRHSMLGIAYLILLDLRDGSVRLRQLGGWSIPVGIVAGVLEVALVIARLLALPLRWTRRIVSLLWESRHVARVRWLFRRVAGQVAAATKLNPVNAGIVRHMLEDAMERRRLKATAQSIAEELALLELVDDDIVIWTTTTERELRYIVDVLERLGMRATGLWHFIMREPIFLQEHKNFTTGEFQRGLRALLARVRVLIADRAHFWTDTPELSEQYSALQLYKFGTLGIPVSDEIANGMMSEVSDTGMRRLVLGYVGDARPEKGFGKLPALINALATKEGERPPVKFLVQTNFNVPNGVVLTRAARLCLEHMDNFGVETIDRPQTSAEYAANIRRVDVMLLNYESPLYFAGSSGILAEALLAGRPVVVTDKTWGGRLLRNSEPYRRHMKELAGRWAVGTSNVVEAPANRFNTSPRPAVARSPNPSEVPAELEVGRWTEIPRCCTHAIVIVTFHKTALADAIKVTFEQVDAHAATRSTARYMSAERGEATAIIPLVEDLRRVRVGVERLDAGMMNEDMEIRIVMARIGEDSPIAAAGVCLASDADYAPAVLEVCKYYDHYRRTATEVGAPLRFHHNVGSLVAAIVDTGRKSSSTHLFAEPQLSSSTGTAHAKADA